MAHSPRVGRLPRLERGVFQFLAIYRYFSFMLAVGLMLVLPGLRGEVPPPEAYLALGVVGGHVIFRVFLPHYPRPGSLTGYLSLGIETAVALGSVLATGGLNSGLLLYSLAPVITVSLLLEERVAYLMAGLSSLVLMVAHTLVPAFPWILLDNYLVIFLLYAMASYLVAMVPFRTNLNVGRRLVREAILEERLRLRREVHDTLAQQVGFLNLKAQQIGDSLAKGPAPKLAEEIAELQSALHSSYQDIRGHLDALSLENDFPLIPALREMANDFAAAYGIPVETNLPQKSPGLGPLAEVHLVRIAQEALTNIRKHSGARRAYLTLNFTPDIVELKVIDDGRGFTPAEAPGLGHYGLASMRERAQEMGAELTITSSPGQGTQVRVKLPRKGRSAPW